MKKNRNKITLEQKIRELTDPALQGIGQFPRPWMTRMKNPAAAKILILGKNQATTYYPSETLTHKRFVNALFNRKGESCRALHREITGNNKHSPTRKNIEALVAALRRVRRGQRQPILETNVICYSTRKGRDLNKPEHKRGAEVGRQIFRTILESVRFRIIIVHGKKVGAELGLVLQSFGWHNRTLPLASEHRPLHIVHLRGRPNTVVFVIRSLAEPEASSWTKTRPETLRRLARKVRAHLGRA